MTDQSVTEIKDVGYALARARAHVIGVVEVKLGADKVLAAQTHALEPD